MGSILDEEDPANTPRKLVDMLAKKLIKMVINKLLEYEVQLSVYWGLFKINRITIYSFAFQSTAVLGQKLQSDVNRFIAATNKKERYSKGGLLQKQGTLDRTVLN